MSFVRTVDVGASGNRLRELIVATGKNRMSRLAIKIVALSICAFGSDVHAGWHYIQDADPLTDADRSAIVAGAELLGDQNAHLSLALKCLEDGLNVLLGHKYLGGDSDNVTQVQTRVDRNQSYGPKYWKLMSGNELSWMPLADAPRIVREMQSGTRLHIRVVDPADGEVLTQSVSLRGFSAAVAKLSCF